MDKFIQIFIDFIPYDKEFVKDLMPKYEEEFRLLGRYIEEHCTSLNCTNNEFMEELIDFLDGNGFEVVRPQTIKPHDFFPIKLIPIYVEKTTTLEEEIEKVNEKLKTALKKIQSTVSEYVPVQTCTLSYTSMEDDQGYILEYEKLLASWTFWLSYDRQFHKQIYIKIYIKKDIHPP